MYKLMSGNKLIGVFQKVIYVKKIAATGTSVECPKGEANGIVAGGVTYAITNSDEYKNCEQVAVFELDSEIERTAELDYMRAMANLV